MGWKGNNWENPEQLVRELAYVVAAKVTLNPHTQNRRMRHPNSLHEPVGHPSRWDALRAAPLVLGHRQVSYDLAEKWGSSRRTYTSED